MRCTTVIYMITAIEAKQISDDYIKGQFEVLSVDRYVRKAAAKGQKVVVVDDPSRLLAEETMANSFIRYLKDNGYEATYNSSTNTLTVSW